MIAVQPEESPAQARSKEAFGLDVRNPADKKI